MTTPQRFSAHVGKKTMGRTQFASDPGFYSSVKANLKNVVDDLNYVMKGMAEASPDIIYNAMVPTFEKSQEYVPYNTGALHDSGYLEIVSRRGNIRVEMGYGAGGNPFYATVVHEDVSVFHKPPTRSKYLQAAMEEDFYEMWKRIQAAYQVMLS